MVEAECKMMVEGRELVAAMPAQGGGWGVVKPYGLGMVEEESTTLVKPARGALGELSFFGYATSRPFMLEEAYVNGTAREHLPAPVSVGGRGWVEGGEEEYDDEDEEEYWDDEEQGGDDEGEGAVEEEDEMDGVEEGDEAAGDMDVD